MIIEKLVLLTKTNSFVGPSYLGGTGKRWGWRDVIEEYKILQGNLDTVKCKFELFNI